MARVVIENLSKTFRGPRGESIPAVAGLTLTVEDKELLVIVGPSGCGKTTTLRLIAGLEEPDGGSISMDDRTLGNVPPKDRNIAMMFQNHALYPHMTAYENMAFGLKLRNCSKPEIDRLVREAAATLDLADCLSRMPGELSGGERQRVALGRAIVRRPKVFLLDEPLSNLDAPTRAQMRGELLKLHARLGATMIHVTHDQVEAMTLAQRMVVMNEGRAQQIGEPMALYRAPVNLFVAGFLGSPPMNLLRGAILKNGGNLVFQGQTTPAGSIAISLPLNGETTARLAGHVGKGVILGIRPEHIAVSTNSADGAVIGKLEANVERIETIGPESHLFLASGGQSLVARIGAGERVEPDGRITVRFDARSVRFFDPVTERAIA